MTLCCMCIRSLVPYHSDSEWDRPLATRDTLVMNQRFQGFFWGGPPVSCFKSVHILG